MTLQDSNGNMEIKGQLTEAFGIERGKRQGDTSSTTLFNIVLEMIRNIDTNPNETIFNRTIQCIAYADDVLILLSMFGSTDRLNKVQ